MDSMVRVSGVVMCVMVPDPGGRLSRAWTGNREESGYEVILREETRIWSIKFPAAPESTSAVETVPEGQPACVNNTKKGLAEHFEDGILTPSAGVGISCYYPSALMNPELGRTRHC
jgi:hypothetical protein